VVGDRIVLRGRPPTTETVPVALAVARLAPLASPDTTVVDWFGRVVSSPVTWRAEDTDALVAVLQEGDARSLRFLDVTGVLDRALPEVGAALARRRADPGELDPTRILQLPTVQRIAEDADRTTLLAGLVSDVCATGEPGCAESLAARLHDRAAAQIVEAVVGATLLGGALANPDAFGESSILQLAEHFGDSNVVEAAYAIAAARLDEDDWRRKELDEIRDRVLTALAHPDLRTGTDTLVESRRRAALASLGPHADGARSRLEKASPTFLMSHVPAELARQASLVGTLPRRGVVRVVVDDGTSADTYRIDVSCRDRPGLLARLTDALASSGLDVVMASLTTWPDGGVLDSFVVRSATRPDPGVLTERMERRLTGRVALAPLADLDVTFDDSVFPWHTQCVVRGPDRRGLLAAIAAAFDSAKVDVHAARVGTGPDGQDVENHFQITDRHGRKLDARTRASVLAAFDRAR
jgi:predicted amino acid-binding ACT domain protein